VVTVRKNRRDPANGAFPALPLILWFTRDGRRRIETPIGTDASERRTLAVELQTSASLVDASLKLLSEHWSELSDERRRQVLAAAWERAHHVAERLDEATGGPGAASSTDAQQPASPLHEVE
jgi:hypothetical protein